MDTWVMSSGPTTDKAVGDVQHISLHVNNAILHLGHIPRCGASFVPLQSLQTIQEARKPSTHCSPGMGLTTSLLITMPTPVPAQASSHGPVSAYFLPLYSPLQPKVDFLNQE